jgi:hypothetical protein
MHQQPVPGPDPADDILAGLESTVSPITLESIRYTHHLLVNGHKVMGRERYQRWLMRVHNRIASLDPPRPLPKLNRKTTFDHIGVFTMDKPLTSTQKIISDYVARHHNGDVTTREHTQDNVRRSQLVIERWNAANRAMWKSIGGRK